MKVLLSHHRDVDDNILVSLIDSFAFQKRHLSVLYQIKKRKENHICIGCL